MKNILLKKVILTAITLILLALAIFPLVAYAEAPIDEVQASSAKLLAPLSKESILVSETGEVLYEHNATTKRPIASMTKIMTLVCIYDSIESGKLSLDDEVVVSQNAASMGGSQVFLDANTTHRVEDLVKSIIICSANDSCVALAEHLSGSVENFVALMNQRAKELQLVSTNFENCTGLPSANQYSCASDVAKMTTELIKHPHYFQCANTWMEDYNHPGGRITGMTNTNKLVRFYEGCDGGKTGFTNEALHCLSATAKRGDTRFIAVVVGAPDSKTRFAEVSNMLNYGFANYESKVMLDENSKLEAIAVECGKSKTVEVCAEEKLLAFGKKGEINYSVEVEAIETLKAPIAKGDVVGVAKLVDASGSVVKTVNIVANESVEKLTYWDYLRETVIG